MDEPQIYYANQNIMQPYKSAFYMIPFIWKTRK